MTAITASTNKDNKDDPKSELTQFKPGNQKSYKWDIVWFNLIGFAVLHLATLYGYYLMFTGEVKFATFLWMFFVAYVSVIATTMGAHRLFTHKTFKANFALRTVLLVTSTIAGQNCLWVWVRDHRQHHKYSDTDADPHNASRGFFFSHIGWLMVRKHPDVIRGGKLVDMSDLNADPLIMLQKKYYKTWFTIFSIGIPTLVPYYFWNEGLWISFLICFVTRLVTVLNGTWNVNSLAHIYGYRPFSKEILPTENWFVSFIGAGEGWHNYHHSFPWDYRAAEMGQHFNITTLVIDFCAERGWAWGLKAASPAMVKYRATKRGDGSHRVYSKVDDNNNEYAIEDEDYIKLKSEAETIFNEDNNNPMFLKKDDEHEKHMKVIEGIYKLVD
ncbi:hypothetical protein M8J77_009499 [Diaphorina citri]|nr:hypothetical protein M8J77_009499 [Diaphorina citri]